MSLSLSCCVVAQASPPVGEAMGWGLYIIYSGICVFALIFVRYAMVETRGKTLEEMSRFFGIEDQVSVVTNVCPCFATVFNTSGCVEVLRA